VGNAFRSLVDHRFLEPQAFGTPVLKIQVGVIGFALKRVAQNPLERSLGHPEAGHEEAFRFHYFIRHRRYAPCGIGPIVAERELARMG
jgi:hypothetical protein